MLTGIIKEVPRVYVDGDDVCVDVMGRTGLVASVAMSPHVALLLADALRRQAADLIAGGADNVVIFPSAEHG